MRVAHLVDELLGHPGHGDAAARAGMLGHVEAAVGAGLDDRIPDVGEVGHALPVHEAIPAGALGAAFDGVSGHGAGREQIPRVAAPSEGVHHRPKR